jgi:hypothetical protein
MEILLGVALPTIVATLTVRAVLYFLAVILGLAATTRRSILAGALYGSLAGVILGPVAIFALMIYLHSTYGTRFLGLEILAGPTLGAVVFAVPGAVAGAIQGVRITRRGRANGAAFYEPADVKPPD